MNHGYCSYKALFMDQKQKCPYSEYIKIYFKSTGHPVSTGFFGYFHVISKGRIFCHVFLATYPKFIGHSLQWLILIFFE